MDNGQTKDFKIAVVNTIVELLLGLLGTTFILKKLWLVSILWDIELIHEVLEQVRQQQLKLILWRVATCQN